jgi:hypothetical protein
VKSARTIFRFFFSLYAFVIFLGLLFLLFPLFMIAALGGKVKGGNAIMALCRFWGDHHQRTPALSSLGCS